MMPIHGLRHPAYSDTNGWIPMVVSIRTLNDFFQTFHVEHVDEYLPQVEKYLSLPPGFRFLIDDNEYEDIWFDESLLKV
jgi:hypothetical protein